MYALASTTATVLRGTTLNAYGDTIDDPTNAVVVARGVPAQIIVTTARPYDPSSQTIRVIQTVEGRVQSDTDIVEGDQLVDESTNVTYSIESVTQDGGPGFVSDLELVLRRVT